MQKSLALMACVCLSAALSAQVQNNAGLGAVYRTIQLDPLTGNDGHLGCAVRPADGHIFVSARGIGGAPPHKLYEFTPIGGLLRSFNQPSVHDSSPWGMRDLAVDNAGNLIGGSENGVTIIDSFTGALVSNYVADNGPIPVTQPIRGGVLAQLGVIRGMAFDPAGNNGNGSFWTGNYNSALVEFDADGTPLNSYTVGTISVYGIAIDPVTGNLLINSAPNFGRISEVAITVPGTSAVLTGNSIPMALTGNGTTTLQGGLSLASSQAGIHERWFAAVNLVELTQNSTSDVLSIRRLHLFSDTNTTPNRNGWNETNLQSAVGTTGTLDTTMKTFGNAATLRFKVNDPTGVYNGLPAWVFFNVYGDADLDAYTDLTGLLQGGSLLVEMRCLMPFSVPSSPLFTYAMVGIGQTISLPTPGGIFQSGDRVRLQAGYIYQPPSAGGLPFTFTNEIYFTRQ